VRRRFFGRDGGNGRAVGSIGQQQQQQRQTLALRFLSARLTLSRRIAATLAAT